jgi:hypothetical protein
MRRPQPRSTAKQGGAAPPRDAVRVVDNVRTIRPDLLLHSREPGGMPLREHFARGEGNGHA